MSPFWMDPDQFDSLGAENRRLQNHDAVIEPQAT